MKRKLSLLFILLLIIISLIFYVFRQNSDQITEDRLTVAEAMGGGDTTGYARALEIRGFKFPADHGAHPQFKTEWWYFTGNLFSGQGRSFGYQFTIFRTALTPFVKESPDAWSTNQVYMGHFAISDIQNEKFYNYERFARGNNHLAGAQMKPFKVWLEDWQITATGESGNQAVPDFNLKVAAEAIELDINLKNLKPVVFQGENGLSQKGAQPGNASYYYSLTRLKTSGTIKIAEDHYQVQGLSWLDREWSTSALGENQVGWDWFSLQLENYIEIMYYQIRQKNNVVDPHSKGSLVFADGRVLILKRDDLNLEVTGYWQSPLGDTYPSGWMMKIPAQNIELEIQPLMDNQELDVSIRYWEGAVSIKGVHENKNVSGNGYVELTGYAQEK